MVSVFMLDHMLSWIFIVLVHLRQQSACSLSMGGHIIMIHKQPISRSLLNT